MVARLDLGTTFLSCRQRKAKGLTSALPSLFQNLRNGEFRKVPVLWFYFLFPSEIYSTLPIVMLGTVLSSAAPKLALVGCYFDLNGSWVYCRPYDECAATINRNNYMSAQEAIDFGLIDSITWKREAQNSGVQKSNSVDTPTLPPAVLTVEDKKLEKSGTSPYQR